MKESTMDLVSCFMECKHNWGRLHSSEHGADVDAISDDTDYEPSVVIFLRMKD